MIVRLELTGTGAAELKTGLAEGSDSPDVIDLMTCTFAEGACERSEDLDDDIRSPEVIELTVTATPEPGTTLKGWSGDCGASAEDPLVATMSIGEERAFVCSAEFEGPTADAVRFHDDFSTETSSWASTHTGSFNGLNIGRSSSQGNPAGFLLIQQSMGDWVYAFYSEGQYYPAVTGAIDSIAYQEDRRIFFPASDVTTASLGAVVAIWQGTVISTARFPDDVDGQFQTRAWQTRRAVFRASDFSPQPDFSTGGDFMVFGFGRRDEWRTGTLIQHGVDNVLVTVYYH